MMEGQRDEKPGQLATDFHEALPEHLWEALLKLCSYSLLTGRIEPSEPFVTVAQFYLNDRIEEGDFEGVRTASRLLSKAVTKRSTTYVRKLEEEIGIQ